MSTTLNVPVSSVPAWPEVPLVAETSLGRLIWSQVTLATEPGSESATNPVFAGSGFAFITQHDEGFELWSSAAGIGWSHAPLPDDVFGSVSSITGLTATPFGLVATGWVAGRSDEEEVLPAAWLGGDAGWVRLDLRLPDLPPSPIIDRRWLGLEAAADLDGHPVFVGGVQSDDLRWRDVLGLESGQWWDYLPNQREGDPVVVVVRSDGGPVRTVLVEARSEGDILHVQITDRDTGMLVFEGSQRVARAGMLADSIMGGLHSSITEPYVWTWRRDGGFDPVGLAAPGEGLTGLSVAASSGGIVVLSAVRPALAFPDELVLWHSADGRSWKSIEGAFDAWERVSIGSAVGNGEQLLALGTAIQQVTITEKVTARALRPAVWVSSDGQAWSQIDLDAPGFSGRDQGISTGPLGWVVSGEACDPECGYEVWLSTDTETWDRVALGATHEGETILEGTGTAIGDNAIITVGRQYSLTPQTRGWTPGPMIVWVAQIER